MESSLGLGIPSCVPSIFHFSETGNIVLDICGRSFSKILFKLGGNLRFFLKWETLVFLLIIQNFFDFRPGTLGVVIEPEYVTW